MLKLTKFPPPFGGGFTFQLFALHFETVKGTESHSFSQLRTHRLGTPKRSIDNQQTSLSELLSTIIWERGQSDQERVTQWKIALAIWHHWNRYVNFCTRSGPYQHEAHGPSGPGPWTVAKTFLILTRKFQIPGPPGGYTFQKSSLWSCVCFLKIVCYRPQMIIIGHFLEARWGENTHSTRLKNVYTYSTSPEKVAYKYYSHGLRFVTHDLHSYFVPELLPYFVHQIASGAASQYAHFEA